VLLLDLATTIKGWASVLKPGSTIVIDVPTQRQDPAASLYNRPKKRNGLPTSRHCLIESRIRDIRSLEKLYEEAGLMVVANQELHSGKRYERDVVFKEQISATYKTSLAKANLEEQGRPGLASGIPV
jgi:predicted SAM-dependent methyltransferase